MVFFTLLNNDDIKCNKTSIVNFFDVKEQVEKIKINSLTYKISNLIQLLVSVISLFTNIFFRFSGIFIEKTAFKEFVEICKQIRKE